MNDLSEQRRESAELIREVGGAPTKFGLGRRDRPAGQLLCSTCGAWEPPEAFMTHPGVSHHCQTCRDAGEAP